MKSPGRGLKLDQECHMMNKETSVNNTLTTSQAATATATAVTLHDAVFKMFGAISI